MVSSPKPPDPYATAAAQTQSNRETAQYQQQLNMTNQYTPTGNIEYTQNGTWTDGSPRYNATTSLSPGQQAIFDQTQAASLNHGTIANEQSGRIRDYLNTPFEFNNQDAENWAYDLGSQRLDPRFAREQDALRTQLISSGIRPGTAAYDQQISQLGQTKNDAYNQLMLGGRQQAYTEALSQRNQPLNEINALMSGSQVAMPTFANTPQTNVAGTDIAGLINQNYQQRASQSNAAMGGLFGLAGSLGSAFMMSDLRLKTSIQSVGHTLGLPVYEYRYIWDRITEPLRRGVMAQDVIKIYPNAVQVGADGYMSVNYSMLGAL